ncbi:hybrid sensor histidine kinase/response regulator [Chelativorans sp. YIM 93263]|uniref:hybrid sensor histidine kinase/response regulator n=1 Tax=Chelativorans sp. YIM 93263 TaxID=2906648 RepID=UPI002378F860|nr:ATP-binding protein [Chelativorans sp. YIM 93263]
MRVGHSFHVLFVGDPAEAARLRAALPTDTGDSSIEAVDGEAAEEDAFVEQVRAKPPDAVVIGSGVSNPLKNARLLRQLSPRSQIVFLLPPDRVDRFRESLPFVPHLGATWTVSIDATDERMASVVHEAVNTSRERADTASLFGRINLQLTSSAQRTESDVRRSQLALSERYLATLLSQSPDAFLAVDSLGALVAWNEAAKQLFAVYSDEMMGLPAAELFPNEYSAEIERLIEAAKRDEIVRQCELPLRIEAGEVRVHGEVSLAPVHDEDGRIVSVSITARDVTARKRAEEDLRQLNESLEQRVAQAIADREEAEEALRQAQKMEALGQLTGGIAHDFNNMLAVVIGSLDLLTRRIGAEPRARRYVDAAMEGARRAATLTQRLLAFARQQPLKPEQIDVNRLVADMSDLLRRSLGPEVRLETVLAGGLWKIHADHNQLESALLNLAVNARDAMPEGGRLTIETLNSFLDTRYAAAHIGVPAGQYVMIAVTDTGTGMTAEVAAKVFDPFFTTKEAGKGTGLGLSQVYGFVKQSGGHIKVYSEIDQGTTVKIYLPRYFSTEEEEIEEESTSVLPTGEYQEVILVVEDEPSVRQFSVDALTDLGYRVLEADSAKAALTVLDAHPEVSLLFTDIVMPDVNGRKLAEEAQRRRPDLKVLFTTGYTRNAIVHNGVLDPGVELIVKPYTIDELAAKVRVIMDAT